MNHVSAVFTSRSLNFWFCNKRNSAYFRWQLRARYTENETSFLTGTVFMNDMWFCACCVFRYLAWVGLYCVTVSWLRFYDQAGSDNFFRRGFHSIWYICWCRCRVLFQLSLVFLICSQFQYQWVSVVRWKINAKWLFHTLVGCLRYGIRNVSSKTISTFRIGERWLILDRDTCWYWHERNLCRPVSVRGWIPPRGSY